MQRIECATGGGDVVVISSVIALALDYVKRSTASGSKMILTWVKFSVVALCSTRCGMPPGGYRIPRISQEQRTLFRKTASASAIAIALDRGMGYANSGRRGGESVEPVAEQVSLQTFRYVLLLALATPRADVGRPVLVDEAAVAFARAFRAELGGSRRREYDAGEC